MAHPDNAMPSRISLAARHLCRIRRLLHGRSVNGLVRLGLALPSLLNGIQEAVAEEIEHVLQSRQARRGAKRQRGEAAEGEEEEVEIEADEEVEPQHEEVAMMQSNRKMAAGRATAKEEAWRPLTQPEKRRVAEIVKALLEFQTNAEPSLTVLAYVEAPPVLCGREPESEEDRDLDISLGELRPALLTWLWATPRQRVPAAVEAPGRTHPEPATTQAIARQLQSEVRPGHNPILDQVLRSWSDSADIGSRGSTEASLGMTLRSAWSAMPQTTGNGTDWAQQHEDPDTLGVRTQLLGPQDAWPNLDRANRKAILDAILNALPERRVKQQASSIAQLYNHVGDAETPQSIITFRVQLRRPMAAEGCQTQRQN